MILFHFGVLVWDEGGKVYLWMGLLFGVLGCFVGFFFLVLFNAVLWNT